MAVQLFMYNLVSVSSQMAHAVHLYDVNSREGKEVGGQASNQDHPAARVYDAFADGSVSRMLEAQKTMPSATYPGQVLDYLLGLGMYHPAAEKIVRTGKELLSQEKERYCGDQHMTTIFERDMPVSLKVIKHPNGTCTREEIKEFRFAVSGIPHGNRYWASHNSGLYCRIQHCISEFFSSCFPNCFSCESGKGTEGEEFANSELVPSKALDKVNWVLWADNEQARASGLNLKKISGVFNQTVEECEQVEMQRDKRDSWIVVTSLGTLALWAVKRFRDYKIVRAMSWVKLL